MSSSCTTEASARGELDRELEEAGIEICFAEMTGPVKDRLKRYGLFANSGVGNLFPTIGPAVDPDLVRHGVEPRDGEAS